MWTLYCAAIVHLNGIAVRHQIDQISQLCHDIAILCCRIISGMSIIDPMEPSVTAIWLSYLAYKANIHRPLSTIFRHLDPSGKIWVTKQLKSIAKRYQNPRARMVAQQIHEKHLNGGGGLFNAITK
jgi:hypothetical protein